MTPAEQTRVLGLGEMLQGWLDAEPDLPESAGLVWSTQGKLTVGHARQVLSLLAENAALSAEVAQLRAQAGAVRELAVVWTGRAEERSVAAMRYPEGSEAGASLGATASTYEKCASHLTLALAQASAEGEGQERGEGEGCP